MSSHHGGEVEVTGEVRMVQSKQKELVMHFVHILGDWEVEC